MSAVSDKRTCRSARVWYWAELHTFCIWSLKVRYWGSWHCLKLEHGSRRSPPASLLSMIFLLAERFGQVQPLTYYDLWPDHSDWTISLWMWDSFEGLKHLCWYQLEIAQYTFECRRILLLANTDQCSWRDVNVGRGRFVCSEQPGPKYGPSSDPAALCNNWRWRPKSENCIRSERKDLINVNRTSKLRSSWVTWSMPTQPYQKQPTDPRRLTTCFVIRPVSIYVIQYAQQCGFGRMLTAICRMEYIEALRPGNVSTDSGQNKLE